MNREKLIELRYEVLKLQDEAETKAEANTIQRMKKIIERLIDRKEGK